MPTLRSHTPQGATVPPLLEQSNSIPEASDQEGSGVAAVDPAGPVLNPFPREDHGPALNTFPGALHATTLNDQGAAAPRHPSAPHKPRQSLSVPV